MNHPYYKHQIDCACPRADWRGCCSLCGTVFSKPPVRKSDFELSENAVAVGARGTTENATGPASAG